MRLTTTDRAAKCFAGQGMIPLDTTRVHPLEKSYARPDGLATTVLNVSFLNSYLNHITLINVDSLSLKSF